VDHNGAWPGCSLRGQPKTGEVSSFIRDPEPLNGFIHKKLIIKQVHKFFVEPLFIRIGRVSEKFRRPIVEGAVHQSPFRHRLFRLPHHFSLPIIESLDASRGGLHIGQVGIAQRIPAIELVINNFGLVHFMVSHRELEGNHLDISLSLETGFLKKPVSMYLPRLLTDSEPAPS